MDHLDEAKRLFLEALALHESGDLPGAEQRYEQALALVPGRVSVMSNLAVVYLASEKFERAKQLCEAILESDPQDEVAHLHRGNALLKLGRPDAALEAYEKALALKPGFADALNNRGNALLAAGRQEEALASYDLALAGHPGYAEAHYNRGNALLELRRYDEAVASYDHALAANPRYAEAHYNRGNALLGLGNFGEADASYLRALALEPDHVGALNNRGIALLELNRLEEVVVAYKKLIDVEPDYPFVRGYLFNAQLRCCEWADYDEHARKLVLGVREGKRSDTPFHFLAISEHASDQLLCAERFAASEYPAAERPLWLGERYRHGRIRIAYLSADFYDHAVPHLVAGLFETHDRERFEVTGISLGPERDDDVRKRLRGAFDRFIDARGLGDRQCAGLLRELEIDIAVDLQGYTFGCRPGIFAHRPAPVQVNYLGFPGTMGATYIDYVLGDRHVIPPEHHRFYTEKVVTLPDSYQINDAKRRIAQHTPGRAELGLPGLGFVFCCFNNNYKISPRVFDIWMRLLAQVDGSVLWLLEDNASVARNLREEARRRGIAGDRLVFAPRTKMENHLARQRAADLFLDTLPYNAHVTASDALWAGLPLVTRHGDSFAGRVATSLLHAVGLPELVTATWTDYEQLALDLARDPDRLAGIKAKLRDNRGAAPLFDTRKSCIHLEAAFVAMWERAERGEAPVSFEVKRKV